MVALNGHNLLVQIHSMTLPALLTPEQWIFRNEVDSNKVETFRRLSACETPGKLFSDLHILPAFNHEYNVDT